MSSPGAKQSNKNEDSDTGSSDEENEENEAEPVSKPSVFDDSDDSENEEEEKGEEEEEASVLAKNADSSANDTAKMSALNSDDDDDDDDAEDDDAEDDDDKQTRRAPNQSKSKKKPVQVKKRDNPITVEKIETAYFLTYMKKSYGIEDENIIIEGVPYACKDGEEMGRLLSSKSPDEWINVKTKHIFMLTHEGVDYLYIGCYVPGTNEEAFDKIRLHSIHKPVVKALVERFNACNLRPEKREGLKRLLEYKMPTEEDGPQINPDKARFPSMRIESCRIPTAFVKPASRPRVLKSQNSKYGRKSAARLAAANALADAEQEKARLEAQLKLANSESGTKGEAQDATTRKRDASQASLAEGAATSIVSTTASTVLTTSPSSLVEASAPVMPMDANSSFGASADIPFLEAVGGCKRFRCMTVADASKTHVHMTPSGVIYIIEEY